MEKAGKDRSGQGAARLHRPLRQASRAWGPGKCTGRFVILIYNRAKGIRIGSFTVAGAKGAASNCRCRPLALSPPPATIGSGQLGLAAGWRTLPRAAALHV